MADHWTDCERLRMPGVHGGSVTVFLRRLGRETWQWGWYVSLPGWGAEGRECESAIAAPLRHVAIDAALLEIRRRWEDVPAVAAGLQALLDRFD